MKNYLNQATQCLKHIKLVVWIVAAVCILPNLIVLVYSRYTMHNVVTRWQNKQIIIPTNQIVCISHGDTIQPTFDKSTLTILRYVDSIGCTPCKLYLDEYISEIHKMSINTHTALNFMCIINPSDAHKLIRNVKAHNIYVPIYIDDNDYVNQINEFEHEERFRTMLLDKDFKVLAIGNFVTNSNIRALYERIISQQSCLKSAKISYASQ